MLITPPAKNHPICNSQILIMLSGISIWIKAIKEDHTKWVTVNKVDNIGPVDRTLQELAPQKQNLKKTHVTCDTWYLKPDIWHLTLETWHVTPELTPEMWNMTCDIWWAVNILSTFQLPSSYGLGEMMFSRFGGKEWLNELMIEWMTKVTRLHRVC